MRCGTAARPCWARRQGRRIPLFAAPTATGNEDGDANIDQGKVVNGKRRGSACDIAGLAARRLEDLRLLRPAAGDGRLVQARVRHLPAPARRRRASAKAGSRRPVHRARRRGLEGQRAQGGPRARVALSDGVRPGRGREPALWDRRRSDDHLRLPWRRSRCDVHLGDLDDRALERRARRTSLSRSRGSARTGSTSSLAERA